MTMTAYIPPRARRALSARIARRNALDRALATARGIPADDPACARFQGPGATAALDRIAARRRSAGLGPTPVGAMAVAIGDGVARS